MKPHILQEIYRLLSAEYGSQGWWPLTISDLTEDERNLFSNGYHPGSYIYPQNDQQRLEISIGAVLTQNTQWKNVRKALQSLKENGLFSPEKLLASGNEQIALAIKSAGYYNQKAIYLKNLARFFQMFPFKTLEQFTTREIRDRLFSIKGIGPETADCILLYALKRCSFVVDAYTRRFLEALELVDSRDSYNTIQHLFQSSIEQDLPLYQEYHALLVLHGKRFYSRKPFGWHDPFHTLPNRE